MPTALLLFLVAAPPTSVAVLEIEADSGAAAGADTDVARQITARVAEVLGRRPGTTVVAPDDIRAVLRKEQQRQLLGCTDEGCLAEIAGALGADVVVSGRLARLDEAWSLSLAAVDAVEVSSIGRANETWGGPSVGLLELVEPMIAVLFSDAPDTLAGALELTGAEPGSEVLLDDLARGTTPLDVLRAVPVGGRRLVVAKEGFRPFEKWIVVRPGASTLVVVEQEALPDDPLYAKWWFWTALGAVAAGGATAAVLAASGDDATGVGVSVNSDDAFTGGR